MDARSSVGRNGTEPVKVAFIHGSLTHARHLQIYEGFDPRYKVVAVGTRVCDIGESRIPFEHRRLTSIKDLLRKVPRIRRLIPWGADQYFLDFEKRLADMSILFPGSAACRYSYQSILMKRKTGVKVVVMDLDNVPLCYYGRKDSAKRAAVLEECDAIVATTHQVKRCLMLEGVPADKIHVIWFGVRTDLFKPGPKDPALLAQFGL